MKIQPRRETQGSPADRHEEARLALGRAVQATRAGLAEMDDLLDRAARLIAHQRSGYASHGRPNRPPYRSGLLPHRSRRAADTGWASARAPLRGRGVTEC